MDRNLGMHEKVQTSKGTNLIHQSKCTACTSSIALAIAYLAIRSNLCATCSKWHRPVQGENHFSTAHATFFPKARYPKSRQQSE